MPFVSKAQERMMFATKPQMAKEWAALTPSIKGLPEHIKRAATKRIDTSKGSDEAHQSETTAYSGS